LARIAVSAIDFDTAEKQMMIAIAQMRASPNDSNISYQKLIVSAYGWLAATDFANHKFDEAIANQQIAIELSNKYGSQNIDFQKRVLQRYMKAVKPTTVNRD